ncbi:hypothetical protein [Rhodalgimonas zhirmunskyi]|uniref:Uncharacterized protein n=1 Tax=Rhodalgimonas zhirmunskyi TaxID=2964767 RepID=A0AAJ1U2J1_9RHOB|nr:hypothetical protein [Rhodoalgimonas zhirmunskyi]MDQ2092506.1 hypothetical protein [Rhodoalgimonas zhirmunskyi]
MARERITKKMAFSRSFDWTSTSEQEHLAYVRRANVKQLNNILCTYDWGHFPETVLGWATAQKGLDLDAALKAFFNGDPSRFNYIPKQDVGPDHRGTVRLLDSICLRINAGFYLPSRLACDAKLRKLDKWLFYQDEDITEGQRGRWVLDRAVLAPALKPAEASIGDEDVAGLNPNLLPGHHTPLSESLSLKAIIRPLTGS